MNKTPQISEASGVALPTGSLAAEADGAEWQVGLPSVPGRTCGRRSHVVGQSRSGGHREEVSGTAGGQLSVRPSISSIFVCSSHPHTHTHTQQHPSAHTPPSTDALPFCAHHTHTHNHTSACTYAHMLLISSQLQINGTLARPQSGSHHSNSLLTSQDASVAASLN